MLALATLTLASLVAAVPHSAFSRRATRPHRRGQFRVTSQPNGLAQGSATADEGCTLWITPKSGDSCLSLITYSPGMILDDFLELNPELNSACTNLEIGSWYCVDTIDDHDASSTTHNALATPSCKSKSPKTTSASLPKASVTQPASSTPTGSSSSSSGGLLEDNDSVCGPSDPTSSITQDGGPNGKLAWLNCGISKSDTSSGWTPPDITLDQIVYKNLSRSDSVYAACTDYFDIFDSVAAKYNIPAIFLAAFAMQESSCNKDAVGDDGGAWGLMQITTDKCPTDGSSCSDPSYNVDKAASYFVGVLASCNNNPLCAVGQYNGWYTGMSYADATKNQAPGSCCECQQNLDYMNSYFNYWIQGKDGSQSKAYNNLAMC